METMNGRRRKAPERDGNDFRQATQYQEKRRRKREISREMKLKGG
jgi:hypothetical protein